MSHTFLSRTPPHRGIPQPRTQVHSSQFTVYMLYIVNLLYYALCTVQYIERPQEAKYIECWPCPAFNILLNKYFPAGEPGDR
jgi:hypothetical protein